MKIAMVASSASRAAGGIFEVERRLSLELHLTLGHDVAVFAGRDAHTDADLLSWQPLMPNISSVYGPATFGYAPGIAANLNQWQADVAHLHMLWMYPSVAVNRWAAKTRRPYIITLHGMLDPWAITNSSRKKKLALALYEQKNLDQATCIHVLSEAEAKSARAFGLKNPLAIIPNGIDLPELLDTPMIKKPRRRLLFLGRLHPKKGLMNLLQAWHELQLLGEGLGWTLTIAGWAEVNHHEELKQRAGELGLSYISSADASETTDAVLQFLGPQFDLEKKRCLESCDAFVLPSFSEGLPMSVLEAWAYGKPVVMTPMCNLPEGEAAGAAIVTEPTVISLKEGLKRLMMMSDAERSAMGLKGRELAQSRFTWKSVGLRMEQVYHWLVHGGETPSCVGV